MECRAIEWLAWFSPRDGDDPYISKTMLGATKFSPRDGDDPNNFNAWFGPSVFSPRDGDDPVRAKLDFLS